MHVLAAGWVREDGVRCRAWARGDVSHAVLQVMGSIGIIRGSRSFYAAVRPGDVSV
jgi:hypothetical protein